MPKFYAYRDPQKHNGCICRGQKYYKLIIQDKGTSTYQQPKSYITTGDPAAGQIKLSVSQAVSNWANPFFNYASSAHYNSVSTGQFGSPNPAFYDITYQYEQQFTSLYTAALGGNDDSGVVPAGYTPSYYKVYAYDANDKLVEIGYSGVIPNWGGVYQFQFNMSKLVYAKKFRIEFGLRFYLGGPWYYAPRIYKLNFYGTTWTRDYAWVECTYEEYLTLPANMRKLSNPVMLMKH